MAATTEEMTIDIPLQGSDQTLTLEMGAPLEDIILVMTEEKAKHSFWLQIAVSCSVATMLWLVVWCLPVRM